MPDYSAIKTYRGGFYDNHRDASGNDDRVYSAKDMRKPYDTVFSDGIQPESDGTAGNTLKVTSNGGMSIAVGIGNAKVGGAWFENTSPFYIGLDTATATERYDAVIIRNDDRDTTRAASIYIKSLTHVPTVQDLTREGEIYELCLAYVRVPALAESITDANIVDTRDDGSLCNLMSGVGAMVVRTFNNTVFSERAGQTGINIGIPQYNKSRDILIVSVEGRTFTEGLNYTIPSNTYIELTIGLPVIGTRVDFQVLKNVNAAGAESVVQEVAHLRGEMTNANRILEHHYYCNGQTDNVVISTLVSDFQTNYTDYGSMRLVIHGTFGATSPRGGNGTTDNPYYWIRAAQGAASNRRVTLDFTDCKQISINCDAGTVNIIFFGMDCRVIGANVIATGGTTIYMFSTSGTTTVYAENCRFWVTCEHSGFIARSGTFKDCRASVTNAGLHSYCFAPISTSLLRLYGGEYYAYTASAEHISAVVGLTSGVGAVAVLFGVNAPVSARSGYRQTHAVYQTTGQISCAYLISELPIQEVSGSASYNGTIKISKAGLL